MNKIETINWKEFKVDEYFYVSRPISRKISGYEHGNTPYVASGCFNNGVQAMLEPKDKLDIDKGNCITISPVDGYAFYQEKDFLGRGGAGSSIIILRNENLNKYNGLFIASILRRTFSNWTYSDMGNKDIVKEQSIKLPVDETGKPDFLYMETYIKNLESKVSSSLTNLKSAKKFAHSSKVNTKKWKRFHLYDDCLFSIDSGTKLDKVKMLTNNPTINFVGRANANNGITTCVDLIENIMPYQAGNMTLSLGGEYLGSCFIQKKPFYTSQNVVVLIPKWDMPFEVKMFISCMIFKESRTYYKAFIDELNRHIKRDFTFLLPVKNDDTPDWEYMEQYIRSIQERVYTNPLIKQHV